MGVLPLQGALSGLQVQALPRLWLWMCPTRIGESMQMEFGLWCYPATYVLSAFARTWAFAFKLAGARGRLSGQFVRAMQFLALT